MIAFVVIGAIGAALIVFSLILGEFMDFGDGPVSSTALGVGAVMFGAFGAIVTVNTLPAWIAYVGGLLVAAVVVFLVERLIRHLQNTEDGIPESVVGIHGVATTDIDPTRGEVSLNAAQELERRLAWSEEPIPEGSQVVVLEQSGSRVRVQQFFPND